MTSNDDTYKKVGTAFGSAAVIDEVSIAQTASGKRFMTLVQLLEDPKGGRLVRFAYSTGGAARRGPVTLRPRDLEKLRKELRKHPELADELGLGGAA
jgi:hypothetical protein